MDIGEKFVKAMQAEGIQVQSIGTLSPPRGVIVIAGQGCHGHLVPNAAGFEFVLAKRKAWHLFGSRTCIVYDANGSVLGKFFGASAAWRVS